MITSPPPRAIARPSAGLLFALLLAVALVIGRSPEPTPSSVDPAFTCVEPSAAPYLTLERDGDELVVRVDPLTPHSARLEWIEPSETTFRSGERHVDFTLDPSAEPHEYRAIASDSRNGTRWAVRLTLFHSETISTQDSGGPDHAIYSVDAVLDQTRPTTPDPAAERVAVAIPQPDGRRVVQYLARSDAEARGLLILKPRPSETPGLAPHGERTKGGRR